MEQKQRSNQNKIDPMREMAENIVCFKEAIQNLEEKIDQPFQRAMSSTSKKPGGNLMTQFRHTTA